MKVLGIGVDIVETSRIESSIERFGERFLNRVFLAGEVAYCESMKHSARHFAARFAAKEALSKAFGTGIGGQMGWRDIEIRRKENGEPWLVFHGGAARLASNLSVAETFVSLSHTDSYAVANVVVICRERVD